MLSVDVIPCLCLVLTGKDIINLDITRNALYTISMKLSQESRQLLPLLMCEPTKQHFILGYVVKVGSRVRLTEKGKAYLADNITLDFFPHDSTPEAKEKALYLLLIAYAGHDGGFYGETRITLKEFMTAISSVDNIHDMNIVRSQWSSFEGTFEENTSSTQGMELFIESEDAYHHFFIDNPKIGDVIKAMATEMPIGEWLVSNPQRVEKPFNFDL